MSLDIDVLPWSDGKITVNGNLGGDWVSLMLDREEAADLSRLLADAVAGDRVVGGMVERTRSETA